LIIVKDKIYLIKFLSYFICIKGTIPAPYSPSSTKNNKSDDDEIVCSDIDSNCVVMGSLFGLIHLIPFSRVGTTTASRRVFQTYPNEKVNHVAVCSHIGRGKGSALMSFTILRYIQYPILNTSQ
jgi:hypothetical protein